MATKYTHKLSSGEIATRTTQSRTYSHVELATYSSGAQFVWSWIGRPDLVAKCLSTSRKYVGQRTSAEHGVLVSVDAEAINNGVRA